MSYFVLPFICPVCSKEYSPLNNDNSRVSLIDESPWFEVCTKCRDAGLSQLDLLKIGFTAGWDQRGYAEAKAHIEVDPHPILPKRP